MAYITQSVPFGASLAAAFGKVSDGVTRAFTIAVEARDRTDEVRRLQAKSDAELTALGLERTKIVQHVYRDLINI